MYLHIGSWLTVPPYFALIISLNVDGQMASGEHCLDAGEMDGDSSIFKVDLVSCPETNNGPWKYDAITKQIRHQGEGLCADTDGETLRLKTCDASQPSQRWTFKQVQID